MTAPRAGAPRRRPSRACAVAAVAAGVLALGACAGDRVEVAPGEYADVRTDLAADVGLADASVWVGAELVGASAAEGEVNPVVSPLSLQLALALLREGATGESLAQLDAVLGGGDVDAAVAAVRARLQAFEGDVSTIDRDDPPEETLVHVADGVFVQEGAGVGEEFLERVTQRHGAALEEVDFAGRTAKPVLDAWADRETGGLIKEVPLDPSEWTVVTLLNALVFGARWESPFDAASTLDEPFTRADGSVVQVPMMHTVLTATYAEGGGWVAAEVPYRDGFVLRVVRHDGAPLDLAGWRAVATALGAGDRPLVALAMPRWEATVTADLKDPLIGLGVDAIFELGDLEAIAADAFVEGVGQTATITVAEDGTVAAAITQVVVAQMSAVVAPEPDVELRLDSPFEYQVVDTRTGLVLFAGAVGDPSAL